MQNFIIGGKEIHTSTNSLSHTHTEHTATWGRTTTSAPLCVNRLKSVTSISVVHCVEVRLCLSICCPNILLSVAHSKLVCWTSCNKTHSFSHTTHTNTDTEGGGLKGLGRLQVRNRVNLCSFWTHRMVISQQQHFKLILLQTIHWKCWHSFLAFTIFMLYLFSNVTLGEITVVKTKLLQWF